MNRLAKLINLAVTTYTVQVASEDWLETTDYIINVVRSTTAPVAQTITFGPVPTVFSTLTATVVKDSRFNFQTPDIAGRASLVRAGFRLSVRRDTPTAAASARAYPARG